MGCGLMGEQGAELVHSQFNSLVSNYKTIPDPVERLRCVMKEHYLKVSPQIQSVTPPKPKRKKLDIHALMEASIHMAVWHTTNAWYCFTSYCKVY